MFLVNSRHHHFSAAPASNCYATSRSTPYSEGTGLFCRVPWPEFSRAPWIIHPIHLSWFAVRFAWPILRSFSRKQRLGNFGVAPSDSRFSSALRICLQGTPTRLHRNPVTGLPTVLRPSIARSYKYGTVNPFPISYAFQPGLRDRLTLGRLPLPRKPWIYGECVSRTFYRYSCQHNHFPEVQHTFRCTFNPQGTLPYQ